ncbi:glycosyltransferase [Faecalibacillus intestinalis]|uniref:glycosyltransferase n=1 Tax=Faecalibacillus intestinalis TaxID=1982626 RepID=UPI0022E9622D|nr:glycosyltransferase [Faecalibacillus intestinalis]
MKFSVLMSVYKNDNPDYFKLALESVSISQTVKPNQIVIIEDGSVSKRIDGIIDHFKITCNDIEFTIIKNETNIGLAKSLNKGINYCKYEWIARMDADDIAVKNRFEKQLQAIKNDKDITVIGGKIEEFNNSVGDLNSERLLAIDFETVKHISKTRNPMNHMTVMYRKENIIKVNCYDEKCGKLEDYKLWITLLINGAKIVNLPDTLVYARVGNGFVSRRSEKREIYDWDNLQDYMRQNKYISFTKSLVNKCYIRVFMCMPSNLKTALYKYILRNSQ